jgi:hypothetical protein
MLDEIEEGDAEPASVVSAERLAAVKATLPLRETENGENRPGRGDTVRRRENSVIRQAISCDICGTEKKQTNHWFVAYDQGGELRVSGWNSRNRLRPGSKHLCGQTCLHKLVDEFMAKAVTARSSKAGEEDCLNEIVEQTVKAETRLTPAAAVGEIESSARLITAPTPILPSKPIEEPVPMTRSALRGPMELIVVPSRPRPEEPAPPAVEPPRFASRNWRAEAWERERERETHASERRPGMARRRVV